MIAAVLGRLVAMVAVILVLVAAVLALQRVVPGDPARLMVGVTAKAEIVEAARKRLGLDQPLPVQYVAYLRKLAAGDLQMSLHTRRPVATDLGEFFPATLELVGFALILAIVGGAVFGLGSAGRWPGFKIVRTVAVAASAMPVFLLAMLGILFLYGEFGWLPGGGRSSIAGAALAPTGFMTVDALLAGRLDALLDALWHLVLPAACLAIAPAVGIGRTFRGSLVGTLRANFIRTARAKGLSERRVLFGHAVRNSLGPTLSVTGIQVAIIFANVVIVESVFAWPGIGRYTAQGIINNDYPAIAGVTLTLGVLYIVVNAIVDLLQIWADPRQRAA